MPLEGNENSGDDGTDMDTNVMAKNNKNLSRHELELIIDELTPEAGLEVLEERNEEENKRFNIQLECKYFSFYTHKAWRKKKDP